MAYQDVYTMTLSTSLRGRVAAAAATEAGPLDPADPDEWAAVHRWDVCSAPGWGDAWASAEAATPGGDHGADPAVITDAEILSQVQAVLAG